MDIQHYDLCTLFHQLGLPADEASIDGFIAEHAPLPRALQLADAPFWTPAQARFLREEILVDADWCEAVDQLNVRLHP